MNLSSYLARTAMANTEALGKTEVAKQRMQNELAVKQEEAQGQAIGGLTGALLGVGAGAYKKYNADQESQDALRGFEARKGFDDRLIDTAAQGKADLAANVGPVSSAYQSGLDRTAALRAEMADATQTLPRISQTNGLFSGPQIREVPNDPMRDWSKLTTEDAEKFIDASGVHFGRYIRSRR